MCWQRYRTRARIGDTWAIIFCNCLWTPDAEAMNTMAVFDLKGRRAKPGKALQNMNRVCFGAKEGACFASFCRLILVPAVLFLAEKLCPANHEQEK
jgi:hypothetical protein